MIIKNYYNILNIDPNSNLGTIKKAFRKEVALYHPDNNKAPGARERFEDIVEAFNMLSNEEKRTSYDALLKAQEATNKPIVFIEEEQEEQYQEWQKESKRKSKEYWDFPLAELLALDIFLNLGMVDFSGIGDAFDDAGDILGDIFDLF